MSDVVEQAKSRPYARTLSAMVGLRTRTAVERAVNGHPRPTAQNRRATRQRCKHARQHLEEARRRAREHDDDAMVDLSTLPAIERAEQVIPAYSTYDTLALRDAPPPSDRRAGCVAHKSGSVRGAPA